MPSRQHDHHRPNDANQPAPGQDYESHSPTPELCAAGQCATRILASPVVTANTPADTRSVRYAIDKMDCPTEERLIRNKLDGMAGVVRLDFNLMARELTVHHTLLDSAGIINALNTIGMGPRELDQNRPSNQEPASPAVPRKTLWLLGASGVMAIGAEISAWAIGTESSPWIAALALLSILAGGLPTLRKGWIALNNFTLNINFLMSVAALGAIAIGQWPEAAIVIFLFALAEVIEALSLDRARHAIRNLMAIAPETALVRDGDDVWQEVEATTVRTGQVVRVKPGERVPLDGVITTGQSSVNQAPITGESMPVTKAPGDTVFAGTINENGLFEFQVSSDYRHTTLSRIVAAVQDAQAQRAPTQRFVDNFARYYTPAVVVLALLVAVIPPLVVGALWSIWIYKALVLLVIACPCALVVSTPVTVVSGLAAAARHGILIKGGVYLEEGRKLKTVAFDKTGTLTEGKPVITDIIPLQQQDSDDVLRLAASLDENTNHPVARAIVQHWKQRKDKIALLPVTQFELLAGRGVSGEINGRRYDIGNHRLIEERGICNPALEQVLDRLEQQGKTVVILASDATPLAIFGVADTLRETSREAVAALRKFGVHPVMLTGDNSLTAQAIARSVGIEDARGQLLPEDKLAAITELQQRGPVGMVGDGINDAPALAKANIGFAMGAAGTDTALETADVALMDDDLRKLPDFIRLSHQTARILTQNITLALGIKVVFFGLALAGKATLWMAVFADMGASLLVVFNGLRLLNIFDDKRK